MKTLTINIPDKKYHFFVELLKSIDFVSEYNEEQFFVTEQEQKLIRKRIKNAKPHNFKKWDDIKNSFRFKK